MKYSLVTAALGLGLIFNVAAVKNAQARIACSNGYKIVQGKLLATPYCQDELVARVAREYGVRTSPDEIRGNPNLKGHVCRLVGPDIRIRETCGEVNSYGRGRF